MFGADSSETVNIGLPIDYDTSRADTAGDLACEVDRRGVVAMQVTAQPALDQCGLANHTATAEVPFAREMNVSSCSNGATEPAGDLVVAEINVRAARGTDC